MDKPNLEDVEKAVLESASYSSDEDPLGHLRDNLNKLGYAFPDSRKGEKEAYREARKLWWDLREQRQPLHEIPVTDLNDLPSTKVRIDGKEYYIHGIVHGVRGTSDSVKSFIREKAKDYDSRDGSELFLEQGFKKRFDLEYVGNDFEDFEAMEPSDIFKMLLKGVAIAPISYIALQIPSKGKTMLKTLNEAKEDIRYLPRAKEVIHRYNLPEPLFMDYIAGTLEEKPHTDRSEWMADEMRSYDDEIKEVHAIVGLLHEDAIRYFLNNP